MMILHQGKNQHQIQVLLDTGCSVPLLNNETTRHLQIPLLAHNQGRKIEGYTGEAVPGAGKSYMGLL